VELCHSKRRHGLPGKAGRRLRVPRCLIGCALLFALAGTLEATPPTAARCAPCANTVRSSFSATSPAGEQAEQKVSPACPPRRVCGTLPGTEPSREGGLIIDLPAALRLAETANPRLGQSREAVREALAIYQGAQVLLLPDLNAGSNYHLHNGALQTSFGLIRRLDEQSVYVGGGVRALAAETVAIPAVRIYSHLGDAIFTPLATRQDWAASSYQANATENLVLLDVATRYLELAGAEARTEAWRQSVGEAAEIARITENFARVGQGRDGDFKRARSDALLLTIRLEQAEGEANIAANELARLLRIDPAARLTTMKAPIELVVLVDPEMPPVALISLALRRRWELAVRSAQIAAAHERYRQEKTRPLFPVIAVGFSAGGFGGGSNQTQLGVPSLSQTFSGRDDFDVLAVWTLQNMGLGNVALTRQRRIERDTLTSQRAVIAAQVRREVMSAHAAVTAARRRIEAADLQLAAALRGATEELNRIRAGQGLPIEAINSVDLLAEARQDAIVAVVSYNIAEFRLFVAIGERPTRGTPDPVMPKSAPENVPLPPAGEEIPAGR
jgi:outer membrane protein TolC